jgi:hypothetical protein
MKVLFVHNSYPGQFIHLAKALTKHATVAAIASAPNVPRPDTFELLTYHVPDQDLSAAHPFARRFEAECRRAEQVIYAASALNSSGFFPDVTIVHPGWGESLPIRDLFPSTKRLLYCEYFYKKAGADVGFDPEFPQGGIDSLVRVGLFNASNLLAMVQADKLFCPTLWHQQLFPQPFKDRIDVLHEGVDTEAAKPDASARSRSARGVWSRATRSSPSWPETLSLTADITSSCVPCRRC